MMLGSRTARWNEGGRVLAIIAALTWSLLPLLCPNLEAAEPRHSHGAHAESGDRSEVDTHQHPANHNENQCCTALTGTKFVVPVAASAPAPKVVLISAMAVVAKLSIDHRQVTNSLAAHDATGPPKRSPPKFTNYTPLAPPGAG